jgi:endonuclease/exonuclease/phosphatase family metal-dependent hydrolase
VVFVLLEVRTVLRGSKLILMAVLAVGLSTCAGSPNAPSQRSPTGIAFKVATWNIRSGMGVRGFATTSWSHETVNCTDRSKPINAWGIGLPQAQLERLAADPEIVAAAFQEAWNCASTAAINAILGFKSASREYEGVALLARYGFSGPIKYERIDAAANRWLIGGDVCIDPMCARTMTMFATHLGGNSDDALPPEAGRVLEVLRAERRPHLFMGDLNSFRIDQWNPSVPCTSPDSGGRTAVLNQIEQAGYTDAWKATQSGEGWTGMASRPGCGQPEGNLYKRIDYVFTSGARVLSTTRFGRAAPGADSPSDHVGLIAELEIQ